MNVAVLIWVGAGIAAGVLVFFGLRFLTKWQIIKDTPTRLISDLFEGPGEVEGSAVELGETLQAPISQKPCLAFHFRVKEKRVRRDSDGDRRTTWRTLIDDKQGVLFGIDDGTGIAAVDPNQAELVLDQERRTRSGFFDSAPPHLEATLSGRYGISTKTWIFNKDLRYEEYILEPGERLYVLGEVSRNTPEDPLRFSKGKIPFIISDKSQESLLSKFLWSAVGCWVGAVAVLVACAFFIPSLNS